MFQEQWTSLINTTPPLPDPTAFTALNQAEQTEVLKRLEHFLKTFLVTPADAVYDLFLDEALVHEVEEASLFFTSITRHLPRLARSRSTIKVARLVLGVYMRLFQLFSMDESSEREGLPVSLGILYPRWITAPHFLDLAEMHAYANGSEVSRLILQAMLEVPSLQQEWIMLGRVLSVHLQQHLSTLPSPGTLLSMTVVEALVQSLEPSLLPLDALLHAESSLVPWIFSSVPKLSSHLAQTYEHLALTLGSGGGKQDSLGPTYSSALRPARHIQYAILSILSTYLDSLLPSDEMRKRTLSSQTSAGSSSLAGSVTFSQNGHGDDGNPHRLEERLYSGLEALAYPESRVACHVLFDLDQEFHLLSRLASTSFSDPRYHRLIDEIKLEIKQCGDQEGYLGLHPTPPKTPVEDAGGPKDMNERTGEEKAIIQSNISQVCDLLPDLKEGFVHACLVYYQGDVEMTIQHLLEDDLPSPLSSLDRQLPLEQVVGQRKEGLVSSRRNIFDEDSFDVFSGKTLESGKVQQGKRRDETAETMLRNRDPGMRERTREDILRLVATQEAEEAEMEEMEEMERAWASTGISLPGEGEDGTGESEGEMEGGESGSAPPVDPMAKYQSTLIAEYTSNKKLFSRDKQTRMSPGRVKLRKETGLSDEQIEGWATMLERQPARLARIMPQAQRAAWNGQKRSLGPKVQMDRGRGERVRKEGASTASSSSSSPREQSKESQSGKSARGKHRRDEKNKAHRANHHRREAHSRKMGKGMGGLPLE